LSKIILTLFIYQSAPVFPSFWWLVNIKPTAKLWNIGNRNTAKIFLKSLASHGAFALANDQIMEQSKVVKLNSLFEKMVSNSANVIEKRELTHLYQEYINDGRDNPVHQRKNRRVNKVAVA